MKSSFLVPVLLVLTTATAAAHGPHAPPPPPAAKTAPAPAPPPVDRTKEASAGYAIAVQLIVDQRAELQALLDADKLADLHLVAERLSATAKALPPTCDTLGDTQLADVTAQAQLLQDLFSAIDEAGDAGKKEDATIALTAYDAPIAALKTYLP